MADANIIVIGGNADDQDHDIPDNTDPAWRVHQGSTDYIVVDTTNGSEKVELCGSGTGTVLADNAVVVQKSDNTAEFRVQNSGSIRSNGMGLGDDDDILRIFADDDAQGSSSAIVFNVDGSEKMRAASGGVNIVNTGSTGSGAVSIGNGSTAAGTFAITVGRLSTATGTAAVTVGNGQSSGTKAMVFSPDNGFASGNNSQAIGNSSRALQHYEQSFGGATYDSKAGATLRKFVVGQCQTTDGTTTTMLNAETGGSTAMTVNTTNANSTDKSSISFFKIRVMSSVTSAGSTGFAVGDFLCREYDLAIHFVYSASASTITMYSDASGTTIASGATLYAARSNVRASNSTISHATNGIVDAITLTTSNGAQRGSWQFTVDSADTGATIRHTCHVDQVDQILA